MYMTSAAAPVIFPTDAASKFKEFPRRNTFDKKDCQQLAERYHADDQIVMGAVERYSPEHRRKEQQPTHPDELAKLLAGQAQDRRDDSFLDVEPRFVRRPSKREDY